MFNEGAASYKGSARVTGSQVIRLDPQSGLCRSQALDGAALPFSLEPGESLLLWMGGTLPEALAAAVPTGESLMLDEKTTARPRRRWRIGEHDFETTVPETPAVPFPQAAAWRSWLTEDYSGEVDYDICMEIPPDWANRPLRLETGPIEYAATVLLDDVPLGQMLWAPWHMELPPLAAGAHKITLRVANTLANELTSSRVADAWAAKSGPGWPSPYHVRALAFEEESRGGGLQGPITLTRITHAAEDGRNR